MAVKTLKRSVASRDEEFERAFDELYAMAWRASLRILGDPTAAQDVAAETLTRAYVRWTRAAPFAAAWVVRTATNLAIRRLAPWALSSSVWEGPRTSRSGHDRRRIGRPSGGTAAPCRAASVKLSCSAT